MKYFLFTIIFFSPLTGFSQKIFSSKYSAQADVKIYVVENEGQCDLKVFKVKNSAEARGNKGLWYFVDISAQSDKMIYFVKNVGQSDLKIYFVKNKGQSGWRNKTKQHLLY